MAEPQTDDRTQFRQQRRDARAQGGEDARALALVTEKGLGVLNEDAFWVNILNKLPEHMSQARFRNLAMAAILQNPKLVTADKRTLTLCLMEAARMGLQPGVGMREIALFVDGKNEVQYRYEYPGLLKLMRNSGAVTDIDAQTVYRMDRCKLIVGEFPEHEIPLDDDRGEIRGCYAYAKEAGATKWMVEYMSRAQIQAHAERYSEALRQKRQTPWNDPEAWAEMGNKTVLRRLLKMLPRSPEVQNAMAHEDALDDEDRRAAMAKDVSEPRTTQSQLPATVSGRNWGAQATYASDVGATASEPEDQGEPARARETAPPAQDDSGRDGSGRRSDPQIITDGIREATSVKDLENVLKLPAAGRLQQRHKQVYAGLLRDAEAKRVEIERGQASPGHTEPQQDYDQETGEVADDGSAQGEADPARMTAMELERRRGGGGGRVVYTLNGVGGDTVDSYEDPEKFLAALKEQHSPLTFDERDELIANNAATIGMIVDERPSLRPDFETLDWHGN